MIERLRGSVCYLDANVFIYAVEGFERFASVSKQLLAALDAGNLKGLTSELTLAEVLVAPIRQSRYDGVAEFEALLSGRPTLQLIPINRAILRRSAEHRAILGGTLPDAIHTATAFESDCTHFITADRNLKTSPSIELVLLDEFIENTEG